MVMTPRNKIIIAAGYGCKEIEFADSLYEICDAEFSSRKDIHTSFATAKGAASWSRYYLLHEVRKVAMRENIYASVHMSHMVANRLAQDWYEHKEVA